MHINHYVIEAGATQVKEVKEKARAYKLGNQTGDWCRKALELAWGDKTKAFEIVTAFVWFSRLTISCCRM